MELKSLIKKIVLRYPHLDLEVQEYMRETGVIDADGNITEAANRYTNDRCTGSLRFFSVEKSYGFIIPDDGGTDVMIHRNSVGDDVVPKLKPEVKLEYEVEQNSRGLRAKNVSLV